MPDNSSLGNLVVTNSSQITIQSLTNPMIDWKLSTRWNENSVHWRIYMQNFPPHAIPTGPNPFIFKYILTKSACVESPCPTKTGPRLSWEILDPPPPGSSIDSCDL